MSGIGTDGADSAVDEITVVAPPELSRPARGAVLTRLLPVGMAAMMVAVGVIGYRSGARNPAFALLPLLMLASAVTAAVTARHRDRDGDLDEDRDDYLAYLAGLRATVSAAAAAQRLSVAQSHPDPAALWTLVGGPRTGERKADHPDFGRVRVGVGAVPATTRLIAPTRTGGQHTDPVTADALRCLLDRFARVADVPITVGLDRPLLVTGDPDCVRALVRAALCQLAVLHSPNAVRIAAAAGEPVRTHWDWLKWLPHHRHPLAVDDAGPARLSYPNRAAATAALAGLTSRVLLVVEHPAGVSVTGPGDDREALRLSVTPTELAGHADDAPPARPDLLSEVDALVCAQRLASCRATPAAARTAGWPELLGVDDISRADPAALWGGVERLRVPVGVDTTGNPVLLDIREAAERGTGPHGLCVGATGSGKSEFLRTLVLGMLTRHHPETLNLVLIDFKGGATFSEFEDAAHVAAVITNLADEAPLVERMRDVLTGELNRRQELLRATGFAGINGYTRARRGGARLTALPALLVIVDEFSELLAQHPDFLDTFTAIGRLGRSLGVHLLLASQRLEEGRLRGLDAHLTYRICLKTASAAESRIVLGTPDAHELPNIPGFGYLRTASGELTGFQTAFVSGPGPQTLPAPSTGAVVRFTAAPVGAVTVPAAATDAPTVAQAMLARLAGHGPAARRIWLPPLGESPRLGELLDRAGELTVPIGIVDRPYEQRRTPLTVDLSGGAGNVAVVGAPQSGKSTALLTLITALAATHDADRVQIYCLDFGGGALASAGALPQVGSVAGRGQPDLVARTVDEMTAIVARREALRGSPVSDVFLVVDGWATLCREFDRLAEPITALAARGLSYGVHVVLSATRWAELRPGLRDLIGTRIELRLGDPADSEVDRRKAERVPRDRPGRGLTEGGLHMLIARPDGCRPVGDVVAPAIPVLPVLVARDTLPADPAGNPVLGVEERELAAVALDFTRQPHLLIFGGPECGKTSVLRLLGRELLRSRARLLVVDYRRSLLDFAEEHRPAGYAMSAQALTALLPGVLDTLAARMPGATVTPAQLRARSWWSGPELYLLVDDYDLVATAAGNPLAPLLEYLPYAADVGLHLVVARRSAGAARAGYEPVLAALRDLGAMGLLMSAEPDEGPLLGSARLGPLPPGRATLVTRSGEHRIQVAWSP
ncbi:type VII secretion protein EccCb [Mycobacterium sp. M1]|uniref:Type VII secretion protein EccCb n=1 Tax=Mycolicibacter acidiphilus TaxID=2835306 RepID=A0ABS5RMV8_9MYCO|nr:type VII secretion protein EccCb [Mycolicibacter acidiphilus]MBS9535648.1 type VII secretion protein EccCb [Mycolicibacter acidiphilus]